MRVLLISANREDITMATWPLGAVLVAEAVRRAGHDVRLLDLMHAVDPHTELRIAIGEFKPEVLGLSVRNIDDQSMDNTRFFLDQVKDVVEVCRSVSDAPIVLGGAGYSIFPESCLEYLQADMGIQGEGESALVELLGALGAGTVTDKIPGLFLPGQGIRSSRTFPRNLDDFPLPEPDPLTITTYGRDELWLPVQTRRGCPMDCSYCSTGTIEGRLLRKRSPERVVRWLVQWANQGILKFHFVDNTFNLPPSYATDLCQRIVAAGLAVIWRCIFYPSTVDERLVSAMARSGCKEAALGFESGSAEMLNTFHKRFNPGQVRKTSDLLAAYGISRMGFLLLGGPGETRQSVLESLEFADSLNLDLVKITVGIRIYPYTDLARRAAAEGIVSPEDNLLIPRFYVTPGLEDWLRELRAEWISERKNWVP
jgi:radical SAM superfamily enzyme YgiQ (UPF0313 family)